MESMTDNLDTTASDEFWIKRIIIFLSQGRRKNSHWPERYILGPLFKNHKIAS